MSITAQTGVRHGEDLLDAVSWFDDQPQSLSSIEEFRNRVEQIALDLRANGLRQIPGLKLVGEGEPEPRRSLR